MPPSSKPSKSLPSPEDLLTIIFERESRKEKEREKDRKKWISKNLFPTKAKPKKPITSDPFKELLDRISKKKSKSDTTSSPTYEELLENAENSILEEFTEHPSIFNKSHETILEDNDIFEKNIIDPSVASQINELERFPPTNNKIEQTPILFRLYRNKPIAVFPTIGTKDDIFCLVPKPSFHSHSIENSNLKTSKITVQTMSKLFFPTLLNPDFIKKNTSPLNDTGAMGYPSPSHKFYHAMVRVSLFHIKLLKRPNTNISNLILRANITKKYTTLRIDNSNKYSINNIIDLYASLSMSELLKNTSVSTILDSSEIINI